MGKAEDGESFCFVSVESVFFLLEQTFACYTKKLNAAAEAATA